DDADCAVVEGRDAEVVEVGAEGRDVAAHDAVRDRQRPGSVVEEAAAPRPGGVAGQGALLECGPAEVVDAAAAVAGRVAREGAAADRQSPECRGVVGDATTEGGGVAAEGAVMHGQVIFVVDAAAVTPKDEAVAKSNWGSGVAGEGTAADG